MKEIRMGWSHLHRPIELNARLIIQAWEEGRDFYTDPDVRIVAQIGDHDVVYDGTATLASLTTEIERIAEGLEVVETAKSYALLFGLIKAAHEVATQLGGDFSFE